MTSILRVLAGKGDCAPFNTTVQVPDGLPVPQVLHFTGPDGSEGTIDVPYGAQPGDILQAIIPSAYPNWEDGASEYAGDWVGTEDQAVSTLCGPRPAAVPTTGLPARSLPAMMRPQKRLWGDPGHARRQAAVACDNLQQSTQEHALDPCLHPLAAEYRRVLFRREEAKSLAAQASMAAVAAGAPPGAQADEAMAVAALEAASKNAIRLHESLLGCASAGPSGSSEGFHIRGSHPPTPNRRYGAVAIRTKRNGTARFAFILICGCGCAARRPGHLLTAHRRKLFHALYKRSRLSGRLGGCIQESGVRRLMTCATSAVSATESGSTRIRFVEQLELALTCFRLSWLLTARLSFCRLLHLAVRGGRLRRGRAARCHLPRTGTPRT